MNSCLYTGWVRHRRFAPTDNSFRYKLFMTYLDLAELPELFDRFWLWSARGAAPAWFKREDYHGDPSKPLDTAVRDLVEARLGRRPLGPVRLLAHMRFFGYCFNPVSFYYCFDPAGERVETIVAEITNTPWKERHAYVLPLDAAEPAGAQAWRFQFGKEFHVSPFMPMEQRYDWRFTAPGDELYVHMENWQDDGGRTFDATLNLHREPIGSASLARALVHFPLVTVKVGTLIYWQALRLMLKRTPFFTHPAKLAATQSPAPGLKGRV